MQYRKMTVRRAYGSLPPFTIISVDQTEDGRKRDSVEYDDHGAVVHRISVEYDAAGRCVLIPALGRKAAPPKVMQARAYPVQEAHGFIYLWWGKAPVAGNFPPLPFFDTIEEARFAQITFRDPWATHYSRVIENQLDVVHLPFVHYNTIGRGNRTLVNGPLARRL